MEDRVDITYLRHRIQELEEKIEQLRLSRRVLMNLIEKIEKDKLGFLKRLEKENRKLQLNNYRYARWLLRKNRQIVELESKLQDYALHNSAKN
ncbi:MAG TPA: translation initiation factor 2 [Bacillota bacterium]|nr:translation initiation factor 2 [Peptococcaceae bacterium MAG4]NLW39139.1 translation initiation factor 2 [Peptococcaceae bacterium]HPZ42429.1 translation initiation factor 2 [Bacillota bacterium]HQD75095.1 translation initiation factor 2 [Bacillota bacterium]HUM57652.1 translation initiation factor 2 [Bacillota bacterium]